MKICENKKPKASLGLSYFFITQRYIRKVFSLHILIDYFSKPVFKPLISSDGSTSRADAIFSIVVIFIS